MARRAGSLLYNLECRVLLELSVFDVNGTPKVFPAELTELRELRRNDDLIDVEFLAMPRLAAIAEVAWTPQTVRNWDGFRARLGAQGPRWTALGINFYRAPEIPWR